MVVVVAVVVNRGVVLGEVLVDRGFLGYRDATQGGF